jgi:hypothetical protein
VANDHIERARHAVERARQILRDGRAGASDDWISAAESHLALMEAQYREALASEGAERTRLPDDHKPISDLSDRRTNGGRPPD